MKKLLLFAIIITGVISCSPEQEVNVISTTNNYYAKKSNTPLNGEPWIEIDTTIVMP